MASHGRLILGSRRVALVWLLRLLGGMTLLALPFVFIPTSWMAAIHDWLGLGSFPRGPITKYLARSLSAFYAGGGMLALLFSTNVSRYRPAILLLSGAIVALAPVLLWIDLKVGMPADWTWSEGPLSLPLGMIMLWLALGTAEAADDAGRGGGAAGSAPAARDG